MVRPSGLVTLLRGRSRSHGQRKKLSEPNLAFVFFLGPYSFPSSSIPDYIFYARAFGIQYCRCLKCVSSLFNYFQGWCGSADPRKRGFQVRHIEAEDMKKEMEEQRQKKGEERQEINSGVSCSCTQPSSFACSMFTPLENFRLEWSWYHFWKRCPPGSRGRIRPLGTSWITLYPPPMWPRTPTPTGQSVRLFIEGFDDEVIYYLTE